MDPQLPWTIARRQALREWRRSCDESFVSLARLRARLPPEFVDYGDALHESNCKLQSLLMIMENQPEPTVWQLIRRKLSAWWSS